MSGVPKADAAQAPAANDCAERSRIVQVSLARPEGEFINNVGGEIVANIENARPFVARQTIDVFWPAGLTAADRAVIDGM